MPPFLVVTALCDDEKSSSLASKMSRTLMWFLGVAYGIARCILIVEMIRTLFYLPPDAYMTPNWSWSIPQMG